jgi:hypothetical protein
MRSLDGERADLPMPLGVGETYNITVILECQVFFGSKVDANLGLIHKIRVIGNRLPLSLFMNTYHAFRARCEVCH